MIRRIDSDQRSFARPIAVGSHPYWCLRSWQVDGQVALPTIRPADDHRAQLDSLWGLSRENSHLRFSAAHCRAFGGQASAPRVPNGHCTGHGFRRVWRRGGESEEPLGTMPVTLIAYSAGLSARP